MFIVGIVRSTQMLFVGKIR